MEGESITREEYAKLTELVNETLAVSKQNNYYLERMRFWGRVAFWAKVVIWAIVLISPFVLLSYFTSFFKVLPGGAGRSASSTSLFGFPSPGEVIKAVQK